MDPFDVARIEVALGIVPPAPYRGFLLDFPAVLQEVRDELGARISERSMLGDAEAVVCPSTAATWAGKRVFYVQQARSVAAGPAVVPAEPRSRIP